MARDTRQSMAPAVTLGPDDLCQWHRGNAAIVLGRTPDGLELRTAEERTGRGVRSSVGEILSRPLDRAHPLARIVRGLGDHPGPVIDATAGFGADAAVLALASDREVLACESHPVMAAILEDGIGRARRAGLPAADRLTLRAGEALRTLAGIPASAPPAMVVLDPMFPARRRSSALPPKPMQRLRALLGERSGDDVLAEVEALLAAADEAGAARIVLKRPPDAATPESSLGTPTFEISTKLLRWSVWERGGASSDRAAPATQDGDM